MEASFHTPAAQLYAAPAQVIAEEIRSLPSNRKVYERRSGLFFLSDRETALAAATRTAQAQAQERQDTYLSAQSSALPSTTQ